MKSVCSLLLMMNSEAALHLLFLVTCPNCTATNRLTSQQTTVAMIDHTSYPTALVSQQTGRERCRRIFM